MDTGLGHLAGAASRGAQAFRAVPTATRGYEAGTAMRRQASKSRKLSRYEPELCPLQVRKRRVFGSGGYLGEPADSSSPLYWRSPGHRTTSNPRPAVPERASIPKTLHFDAWSHL